MNSENTNSLSVLFILDSSGSMSQMGEEPIQSLNNFYKEQNQVGEFTSTLISFSNKMKIIHRGLKGTNIPEITKTDYVADGMTALYDTIGEAVNIQKEDKIDNVIVVILTDGIDNVSKKYKSADIKSLIKNMENEHGWTFIYLGANHDAFEAASNIGISNCTSYDYTQTGLCSIMTSISHTISECISNNSNDIGVGFSSPTFDEPYEQSITMMLEPSISTQTDYDYMIPTKLERSASGV